MNDICKLITTSSQPDEYGNPTSVTTEKQVFCQAISISSKEFFSAMQSKLKAELCLKMWLDDYSNEEIVKFNDIKFKVYRTYTKNDVIELYLSKWVGD